MLDTKRKKPVVICDACRKKVGKRGAYGRAWIYGLLPSLDLREAPESFFVDACSKECFPKALELLAKKGTKGVRYFLHVTMVTTDPKEVLESFARQMRAIR